MLFANSLFLTYQYGVDIWSLCLQNATGRYEEYFLFGCLLEASMIERKIGDKPVHFEMSVGMYQYH